MLDLRIMFRWSSNLEFHHLLWNLPLDVPAGVTHVRAIAKVDHSLPLINWMISTVFMYVILIPSTLD